MKSKYTLTILLTLMFFLNLSCQVTEEKIELWKTTQNGPTKLNSTLSNSGIDPGLRASAAAALIEIKEYTLLKDSFEKMSQDDTSNVLEILISRLAPIVKGENEDPQILTSAQVSAKDGLYILYDYAQGDTKTALEEVLLNWISQGNFNTRARAGFNIKVIVQKIGAKAANALAELLTIDQVAIKPIADLIRDIGDEQASEKASKNIASQLNSNLGKFGKSHLEAAAVIGGDHVANTLLGFASNLSLSNELQRYSLRAYSVAIEQGNIKENKQQVELLTKIAQNQDFDMYQREETYMTLAQLKDPSISETFFSLLKEKELFWRLVGTRCLLRFDPKNYTQILQTPRLATNAEDVLELAHLISRFPDVKPFLLETLKGNHPFSLGISILVLEKLATDEDLKVLEQLKTNKTRLPNSFSSKNVGEAASKALETLKKKKD